MDVDTTDLDEQIAALQATKARKVEHARKQQERQAREDAKILIASTPGKKAKAACRDEDLPQLPKQPVFSASYAASAAKARPPTQILPSLPRSGPSRMSNSLAALRRPQSSSSRAPLARSDRQNASGSLFTGGVTGGATELAEDGSRRRGVSEDANGVEPHEAVQREEDSLAIIEKLKPGPREFGLDPEGEHAWEFVEPNSGIRLSKRILSHSILQDHLYGRYFLPPSLLYSVIRLSRDGATYDVAVDGDWVTIAVVAERGEVRVSGSKTTIEGGEDDDDDSDGEEDGGQGGKRLERGDFSLASPAKKKKPPQKRVGKKDENEWKKRRRPKKYINLRLAALPSRSKLLNDTSSGPSGDALLQLLLFEADSVIRSEETDENGEVKRTYKGGSGGAYERWCNLNVGDVVGIIGPRVLRPLRAGTSAPHPLTLPLALNPNTANSLFLIGQSRDLGCCSAIQKDGKRCKTWVDLRQSQICEYHVHLSVQRSRSGRAEFTASTSSYSLSARPRSAQLPPGKNGGINHRTKTGLLPASGAQSAPRGMDNGGGGATYVVGGNTIRTGSRADGGLSQFGDECLGEKLGRGRAEKRKRRIEAKEAEEMLEKLVSRGQGTMGAKLLQAVDSKNGGGSTAQGGRVDKRQKGRDGEENTEDGVKRTVRPFSVESIKKIGFDPSSLTRMASSAGKDEKMRKEETIALLKIPGEGFRFDPKKKVKVVNVRAPERALAVQQVHGMQMDDEAGHDEDGMVDLD